MLSMSKALGVGTVSTYYREQYSAAVNSHYYSQSDTLKGDWHGKLTAEFGLSGQQVKQEHFERLAEGKHPQTGEVLIETREWKGNIHKRSAYDCVINAAKGVSLAAIVGSDDRIFNAHREANKEAMEAMEVYAQVYLGGNKGVQTTGKLIMASFDHTTARPVDGHIAPHLHTHNVVFAFSEDDKGQARALGEYGLKCAQSFGSAVYHNAMARKLHALGYETTRATNHGIDIEGFTPEYLASESPRTAQIQREMEQRGLTGRESSERIAHHVREPKVVPSPQEALEQSRKRAEAFGNQPQHAVAMALKRGLQIEPEADSRIAQRAVTFARNRLSENKAVFSEYETLRDALRYSRGRVTLPEIERELERQVRNGTFVEVAHVQPDAPKHRYTTREAIADERYVIEAVRAGRGKMPPINLVSDEALAARCPQLNVHQRKVAREVLANQDRVFAIQGSAGTGKSRGLSVIKQYAEENGYKLVGFAPTGGATRELKAVGITDADTLQAFLIREKEEVTGTKRLFVLDESSLAGVRQVRNFMDKTRPTDRILFVGDRRQFSSIERGRIFEELMYAGMGNTKINKLVRQQTPELAGIVKAMAQGRMDDAVEMLSQQGRLHSEPNRWRRFEAIAKAYVLSPAGTMVISPDNNSRADISAAIRRQLRSMGQLGEQSYTVGALKPRQDITCEDRTQADSYRVGDVLLYRTGSKAAGIKAKEYATVVAVDGVKNRLTVELQASGQKIVYNPEKLRGVSVYEVQQKEFRENDRIQFTAPDKAQGISTRDKGTVIKLDSHGNVRVKLDDRRVVSFNLNKNRHIDEGYTTTSYSAQGATFNPIIHVDTSDSCTKSLVNQAFAYVSASRSSTDMQLFTDDETKLAKALERKQQNDMALSPRQVMEYGI